MYSLADNRVMYVPPFVERHLQELAIGPGEPIEICKSEVKNGSRRRIEWKVKRVDASQQPASSAKAPAAAANGVSKSANGHENGSTRPNGQDRNKVLTLEPEQLPMRMMASGLPTMEQALNTAIEIAQRVEGLAASHSYSLRFSSEDIRAIAVTMFIQLTRDGGCAMAGVSSVLAPTAEQVPVTPEPAPVRPLVPALRVLEPEPQPEAANVLSPTQVQTFLDCSAKWWCRYGLRLPEPKTSTMALGSALHEALADNFRQKIETRENLDVCGVTALFRQSWSRQIEETALQPEEDLRQLRFVGEQLVRKYMEEAAPSIDPAGVEFEVTGRIGGVSVRGFIDLMDVHGAVIDIKTAARKPSGSPSIMPCNSPRTGL
jgi:hypothetical protein